nr:ribonuclease H-like domain-containing protein [Tanacetum cinerariifolium]
FQPSGGYHTVPPVYTRTFMPPKPDLVFHIAPTTVENDDLAFNVQLSPTKLEQDLSYTTRPSARIIEDWVSDSKEEFETKATYPLRPLSQLLLLSQQVQSLIVVAKEGIGKLVLGNHKQYAPLTYSKPQKHIVPTAVLTQSKPVSNTTVRPVSAALPNITVTRPIYAHHVVTKPKSPIRRHITHSLTSQTSNLPPRVTAVKALMVSVDQGKQGTWELNGGYVTFGGNPKGGKITGKGKIKTGKIKTGKLDFDDVYFVKEIKFNLSSVSQMCAA